jgi:hypothetical protein
MGFNTFPEMRVMSDDGSAANGQAILTNWVGARVAKGDGL